MSKKSFGRTKFSAKGFNEPNTIVVPVDRKYGKSATISQIFDLSHGKIYSLIEAGLIKSITLREPGRSRGTRLIEIASVEQYLQSLAGQEVAAE
jgi:hypothetical protein